MHFVQILLNLMTGVGMLIVGCFFFNFLFFFFQKEFSFELHAGNLFAIKKRGAYIVQMPLMFCCHNYPIQYSSVRFVTCYIVFNVWSDVHETFLTR